MAKIKTYYLLRIKIRDGEREYSSISVHYVESNNKVTQKELEHFADDYASDFYGGAAHKSEFDEDCYEFYGGEVMVSVGSVEEITEAEYNVFNKFILA